jgi:hypothetical protein
MHHGAIVAISGLLSMRSSGQVAAGAKFPFRPSRGSVAEILALSLKFLKLSIVHFEIIRTGTKSQ